LPGRQRAIRELAHQEDSISRAKIASISVRMLGQFDPFAVSRFVDVRQNDWFYASVSSAYNRRIMLGNGRYFYPSLIMDAQSINISGCPDIAQ